MNLWLLVSVLPLSLAWPAPYNQSSVAVRDINALSRRAAAPVFYPWPGKLKKGGCDEHLDTINEGYDQALEMATQAKNALDILKSARPGSGDDASKDEFNKALKWDKYQKSLKDLFNIEVDKTPDDGMKRKIGQVQELFGLVLKKGTTLEPKDKDKPRLFCGQKGIGLLDPGEKIRDTDKKGAGKYGAWVLPRHSAPPTADGKKDGTKHIPPKMINKKKSDKGVDHPCEAGGDKAIALTNEDANTIWICDGGMDKQARLVASVEGEPMRKTLGKERALSDTLLHEFMHLSQDIDDVPQVKFAHRTSDEPEWEDEAQRIPKRDSGRVYGYLASYQLAQYVPADSLKTVETYVWFAISVFNEDWKFEGKEGVAKKMEWKK